MVHIFLKNLLMLTVAFGFVSCLDPKVPKVQYVPDMADAPTMKAQENYLDPPEHSVANNAVLYPKTAEEAEKVLKNPYPATIEVVEAGKKMYGIYCVPCHGTDAKGVGSITDVYMPAPDLTAKAYIDRGDGFFFHRITFGAQAIMPGYGHATTVHERWQIIHYLRTLQKAGAQ